MSTEPIPCRWYTGLDAFPPETREWMLESSAEGLYLHGEIPDEVSFLKGNFVHLGLAHLGLEISERRMLEDAFASTGVIIPNTNYRLRFTYMRSIIEPVDGTEKATLPSCWKEGVLVRVGDKFTWIGKRVPLTGFDVNLNDYVEKDGGYEILTNTN